MNKIFASSLAVILLLLPAISFAQSANGTSLTITPPFFELNVNPGDSWSSSIRVVNTNPADLPVNAEVMGFGASDVQGHGSFIPLSQLQGDGDALANWVTLGGSSFTVPQGQASDVPFSISVPKDASPGGHYAAILIGTGASGAATGTSQVGVSSFISALIFVRVAGDVKESASVKEFSTDKGTYQTPDVHFSVQIQNNGNVHVRPVGVIQIYNAFGKERGEISINGTGTLGYVLPSSSREFDAEWQGSPSLFDIGPYTAVVSVAYGDNGTKSVSETIGFWILPIYQIGEVLFGTLIAVLLFIYIIRRLVRRMLANELSRYGGTPPVDKPSYIREEKKKKRSDDSKKPPESSQASETIDLRNKNRG